MNDNNEFLNTEGQADQTAPQPTYEAPQCTYEAPENTAAPADVYEEPKWAYQDPAPRFDPGAEEEKKSPKKKAGIGMGAVIAVALCCS